VVSLAVLYLLFYESIISGVASILGRDETLTGRTEIWRPLIDFASQNPVLGVGYGGFYAPGDRQLEQYFGREFILAQAHNGYLAVYVELGICGILLVGVFLLAYCGKVGRELSRSFEWGVLGICFLPILILYNYTEVGFLYGNLVWSTIVFLSVIFSASRLPAREESTINLSEKDTAW
jgi:exopolysaccharide production protein ExoQ